MKLSYKIYILFGIASVVTIFSVFGVTYYLMREILISGQYGAYGELANISAKTIDSFLHERLTETEILATQTIIVDSLRNPSASHLFQIRESLMENVDVNQHVDAIYVIGLDKNAVISADVGENSDKISDSAVQEDLLEKVFSGSSAYSDVFLSERTKEPTMIFASPVFDGRRNIIGAVEEYINWSGVFDLLKEVDVNFIHLINSKGLEIGSNNPANYKYVLKTDYSYEAAYQKFLEGAYEVGKPKISIERDLHRNVEVVMAITRLPGYKNYKGNGWVIVFEDSVESIIGGINAYIGAITFITLALRILFLVGLLWILKKYLLDPVILFSDTSRRIGAGEKNLRIPSMTNDELGVMAKEFNAMVDQFQNLNQNLEARVREKTAQLEKELSAQEAQRKALEQNKEATMNLLEDVALEKSRAESMALDLQKFELAVGNASEHIIITDSDGVILYANKAAEGITGYSKDEIIGNKPSLWGRQMPKEFYAQMWKTIKTDKEVFSAQIRNRRKNGVLYDAEAQISPILDSSGEIRFFVGIERDVTDQKRLDEARNSFIAVASHQLRTPLTAIKWISELLLSGDIGPVADKQKEFMVDLRGSAERMIDLVNALLNIARIESTELTVKNEKINLRKFSENILDEMKLLICNRHQSASLSVADGIGEIPTDPDLLREILKNILVNSIKYTKEGGAISMNIEKSGDETVISVRDNGIGIPKDQQPKIFTRFFRADNAAKVLTDGTGLGMYISKNLTELLGGRIWFESEEGVGTTFHVALPASGPHERKGSKPLASSK